MVGNSLSLQDHQIEVFEDPEAAEKELAFDVGSDSVELSDDQHQQLMDYLMARLTAGARKRTPRLQRYARIDQMVATWQALSKEDSQRAVREDLTGRLQALPMNLPLAAAHIEDMVSFFTEVFAPIGGSFFATPGKKAQLETVKSLVSLMEQDMKQSSYYSAVTSAMNSLCKYNIGGFHVEWETKSRLNESDGNVLTHLDMYNFMYDPTVMDVSRIHRDAEWVAIPAVKNRLWLIRNAEKYGMQNLDKVLGDVRGYTRSSNVDLRGKAKFYKNPPGQTNMPSNGEDATVDIDDNGVNWSQYGLGLTEEAFADIDGHEVITMYVWLNPDQFDLERANATAGTTPGGLTELWKFIIVDGDWIVSAQRVEGGVEIPTYLTRVKQDEMNEATRSRAEHMRPFQRFVSFLLNTHVEGIRKNVWGLGVYDPTNVDISALKNGETSAWIPAKNGNRDVRGMLAKVDTAPDTYRNVGTAGEILNLMKSIFPSQSAPAQIAGMDRAVTSQVSAVLQGSMRPMHMMVRAIDSSLMLPVRMAMYRNIAVNDPQKASLQGITPSEVAEVLGSGLGQVNREAAAEQLRTIIFALIQNPEGNERYDLPGLFQLWSVLLNVGTDLSEFIREAAQAATQQQPVGPDGQQVPQSVPSGVPGPQGI